jgi:hypothetical protein
MTQNKQRLKTVKSSSLWVNTFCSHFLVKMVEVAGRISKCSGCLMRRGFKWRKDICVHNLIGRRTGSGNTTSCAWQWLWIVWCTLSRCKRRRGGHHWWNVGCRWHVVQCTWWISGLQPWGANGWDATSGSLFRLCRGVKSITWVRSISHRTRNSQWTLGVDLDCLICRNRCWIVSSIECWRLLTTWWDTQIWHRWRTVPHRGMSGGVWTVGEGVPVRR